MTQRPSDAALAAAAAEVAAIERDLQRLHAMQAAEAIGHFFRSGKPGPCYLQPPPSAVPGVVLTDGSVREAA